MRKMRDFPEKDDWRGRLRLNFLLTLLVLLVLEQQAGRFWSERETLYRDNPIRFWELNPGVRMDWQINEFVYINSLGMRGPEIDRTRPALRVLLMGDSCIYGAGVKEGHTLDAALQQALHKATGLDVQVCNGGVPGYSTFQGLDFLYFIGRHAGFDVIIFAYLYGDLNKDRITDARRNPGPPISWLRCALWKSRLYRLLRNRLHPNPMQDEFFQDSSKHLTPRVPIEEYAQNLESLYHLALHTGARRVIFLRLPNRNLYHSTDDDRQSAMAHMGRERGIFVDLIRQWHNRQIRVAPLFWDTLHPTAAGCRAIARDLTEVIVKECLNEGESDRP